MNYNIEAAKSIQIKLERTFTGQATTLTKKNINTKQMEWSQELKFISF